MANGFTVVRRYRVGKLEGFREFIRVWLKDEHFLFKVLEWAIERKEGFNTRIFYEENKIEGCRLQFLEPQ